jgi:hypothetical protein
MVCGIDRRRVGFVRGRTRPAGAVLGGARLGARPFGACMAMGLLVFVTAVMTPPAAQAGHDNGTRLCSEKFAAKFKHARHVPIYRGGYRNRRVGRLSLNYQWRHQRRYYRVCAVAIRRFHVNKRLTFVDIARDGERPRVDAGMFWQYAGPIVRGIHAGQSVSGHGQVGRQGHPWVGFGVTWPVGGRPYFDLGWPG